MTTPNSRVIDYFNLKNGYTLKRLNDRGVRNGLNNYRKRVFLLKKKGAETDHLVLIQIIDKKFKSLFQKNLEAFKLLTLNSYRPKLINFNPKNLSILVTWEGESLNNSFQYRHYANAIEYLKSINKISSCNHRFNLPHYINRLIQIRNGLEIRHKSLRESIVYLTKLKKISPCVRYGFGVADPSISNFVIDKSGNALLVDFDNYSTSQDFLYSVGWFISDLQLTHISNLSKRLEIELIKTFDRFERFRYELGKLSRLAPPLLDEEYHVKTEVKIENLDSSFNKQVLRIKHLLSYS